MLGTGLFGHTYNDRRIHDIETQGFYSNPLPYYEFLQYRVLILFKPKLVEADIENPEFSLILSKKHTYDIASIIQMCYK